MNMKAALKVLCLTVIGAPPILAATQGLDIPPLASAVMAVLALAAGFTMGELEPGFRGGVSEQRRLAPGDIGRIADALLREQQARGRKG